MLKPILNVTARIATASFLLIAGLPVLAQVDNEAAQSAPESGAWMALTFAIVFGIAIGIGCFMSPKRTHQD